jgi:hypothetical protein
MGRELTRELVALVERRHLDRRHLHVLEVGRQLGPGVYSLRHWKVSVNADPRSTGIITLTVLTNAEPAVSPTATACVGVG